MAKLVPFRKPEASGLLPWGVASKRRGLAAHQMAIQFRLDGFELGGWYARDEIGKWFENQKLLSPLSVDNSKARYREDFAKRKNWFNKASMHPRMKAAGFQSFELKYHNSRKLYCIEPCAKRASDGRTIPEGTSWFDAHCERLAAYCQASSFDDQPFVIQEFIRDDFEVADALRKRMMSDERDYKKKHNEKRARVIEHVKHEIKTGKLVLTDAISAFMAGDADSAIPHFKDETSDE